MTRSIGGPVSTGSPCVDVLGLMTKEGFSTGGKSATRDMSAAGKLMVTGTTSVRKASLQDWPHGLPPHPQGVSGSAWPVQQACRDWAACA